MHKFARDLSDLSVETCRLQRTVRLTFYKMIFVDLNKECNCRFSCSAAPNAFSVGKKIEESHPGDSFFLGRVFLYSVQYSLTVSSPLSRLLNQQSKLIFTAKQLLLRYFVITFSKNLHDSTRICDALRSLRTFALNSLKKKAEVSFQNVLQILRLRNINKVYFTITNCFNYNLSFCSLIFNY